MHIGVIFDAALAYHNRSLRNERREALCIFKGYLKCLKVAVVYSDNIKSDIYKALNLFLIVCFGKYVKPKLAGKSVISLKLIVIKYGSNKENCICTEDTRFIYLIIVNNKILAEQRD